MTEEKLLSLPIEEQLTLKARAAEAMLQLDMPGVFVAEALYFATIGAALKEGQSEKITAIIDLVIDAVKTSAANNMASNHEPRDVLVKLLTEVRDAHVAGGLNQPLQADTTVSDTVGWA